MLAFVALVALLNLMLGMGAAIVISHDPTEIKRMLGSLPIPYLRRRFGKAESAEHAGEHHGEEHTSDHAAAETEQPNFGLDIPEGWYEVLRAEKLRPRTAFEALLLSLRMQLSTYQPRITEFEHSFRTLASQPTRDTLPKELEQLKSTLDPWRHWANETASWMAARHATLGVDESTAIEFEEKLADAVTHAKNMLRLAASCAEEGKTEAVLRALQHEINRDLEGMHTLVDRTLDQLAATYAKEQRAAQLPFTWQRDVVTGLPNRCGLEALAAEWRANDPHQKRLLSGLFVECDRMGKLNERFGAARSDKIFASFAKMVFDAIRNDRGDSAARISGSTVVVLLADTGAAGARCAAERIRQTIEAATFQIGSEEITLAANCAVTEFMLDDALPQVLRRLHEGIKEAKKAGRNRTAIDEGDGPKVFEALPMNVKGRVVRVSDEAGQVSGTPTTAA